MGKTLPSPCVSTAIAAKAVPFLAVIRYSGMLAAIKYSQLQQLQLELGPDDRLPQADVDSMGSNEFLGFLFFGTFIVMSSFIILNLFIVNVLDTFDVEMRITDRTVSVEDQWGFAFCWAGLTLTTAACPSLQVEDAKVFQDVIKQTLAEEKEMAEKRDLTVMVEDIPDGWLGSEAIAGSGEKVISTVKLERVFAQFGAIHKVKLKGENQAWVMYKGLDQVRTWTALQHDGPNHLGLW